MPRKLMDCAPGAHFNEGVIRAMEKNQDRFIVVTGRFWLWLQDCGDGSPLLNSLARPK